MLILLCGTLFQKNIDQSWENLYTRIRQWRETHPVGSVCCWPTEQSIFLYQENPSLFFNAWWWFSCSVMSNSCNPMDCCPPGSSVHGIFQERILEWVAISKAYPNFNAYSHLGVTPAGLRRFPPILVIIRSEWILDPILANWKWEVCWKFLKEFFNRSYKWQGVNFSLLLDMNRENNLSSSVSGHPFLTGEDQD